LEHQVTALRQSVQGHLILGEHASMKALLDQLAAVAPGELTVLIQGDSGSGKETIARAIHAQSSRSDGPFVVLDCGALPESLIDAELFGHEKGAFSGAESQRKGILELASGGTLFLDEVAELGLETQAKLLRVLADGSYRRLGSEETLYLDARILASSGCDLNARIESGLFREDLFFRLKVVEIRIPPLVDRGRDGLILARHFAEVFGNKLIAVDAERSIRAHDWPGNVRELRHRVQRAVTFSSGPYLTAADFGLDEAKSESVDLRQARDDAKREVEKDFVRKALSSTDGNVTQAARELGLSRSRMNQLLADLEIDPNDFR
jgi:DNA-binding NtrC family response regulator